VNDIVIDQPGVFDIPAEVYHADPVPGGSLSSSGARKLLPPGCPAKFDFERRYPPQPTDAMELGTAAHRMVLGVGADIVPVPAGDWRTKAAQQVRLEARAAGKVALLDRDHAQVLGMAKALREHPVAAALFDPARGGRPEQALFWTDGQAGIWRRALLDWLPAADDATGRMILADYKTCVSADPEAIQKAMYAYGYHQQAPWYMDGAVALGLAEQVAFLFVFQERTPPYLINVVEPDAMALRIGRDRNRQAIDTYRRCTETGVWPGYSDQIELATLPGWVEQRYLQEIQ
jgi:hypothetical protein